MKLVALFALMAPVMCLVVTIGEQTLSISKHPTLFESYGAIEFDGAYTALSLVSVTNSQGTPVALLQVWEQALASDDEEVDISAITEDCSELLEVAQEYGLTGIPLDHPSLITNKRAF